LSTKNRCKNFFLYSHNQSMTFSDNRTQKRRLLIAQLPPYYFPSIGGVERVVQYISEELVRRGHEVHVLTANRNHKGYPPLARPLREIVNGVQVERFSTWGSVGHLGFFPGIISPLVNRNYDIMHCHCYRHPQGEIATWFGGAKNIPVILHIHGGFFAQGMSRRLIYGIYDFLARVHAANRFDHYIALSAPSKEALMRVGACEQKVSVIANAAEQGAFLPVSPGTFRIKHGLAGKKIILFLGSLHFYKRPDLLISALPRIIDKVPTAFLVLVGPDAGEYLKLENVARKLGVFDYFRWMGPLHGEEKHQALCDADLFVLTSDEEPYPLVLLEAMAHGKAIIATDADGPRSMLVHNDTGLIVRRGQVDEIAASSIRLLNNPSLSSELGRKAKEKALKEHQVAHVVDQLEALYYQLIWDKKN